MMLLGSDLDFTILMHGDDNITKKNVDAVKRFMDAGNKFAIITGRQYATFKEFLEEYDLKVDYIAGEDGCIIFDKDLNEIHRNNIKKESVDKISELADYYNYQANFDDGYSYHNEKVYNVIKIFFYKKDVEDNKEFLDKVDDIKDLTSYHSVVSYNIVEKNRKSEALDFIKDREGFNDEDVYAVGDGVADVEMIEKHHGEMLGKGKYKYLYEYIEELMKD